MHKLNVTNYLQKNKFNVPEQTSSGLPRASVALQNIKTLWFNTGTLCNLTCKNCYIESSPTNDRLSYLRPLDVSKILDELDKDWAATEVGFTGGEPFMNPGITDILEDTLGRGYKVLILTNAMRPMLKVGDHLTKLRKGYGDHLRIRVSMDHYTARLHEIERGPGSWDRMIQGFRWLNEGSFHFCVAGRNIWNEEEDTLRKGYDSFFKKENLDLDAFNKGHLILFPEMTGTNDTPEISESCWELLKVDPNDLMCSNSRMIIKKRGEQKVRVQACTLLPYDEQFSLGSTLAQANRRIWLNHPHCSKFCVLGGGTCSNV